MTWIYSRNILKKCIYAIQIVEKDDIIAPKPLLSYLPSSLLTISNSLKACFGKEFSRLKDHDRRFYVRFRCGDQNTLHYALECANESTISTIIIGNTQFFIIFKGPLAALTPKGTYEVNTLTKLARFW